MPTTARSVIRQRVLSTSGFFLSSVTTLVGTTTTFTDTALEALDANNLTNKWALMTAGTSDAFARRISSMSAATATVSPAYPNAIIAGISYEIMPWYPVIVQDAISQAIRNLYPGGGLKGLYLPIRDETLVVDNLVANFDFETFVSPDFTSWTAIGGPTLTQNTSYFVHGSNAANIAGTAAVRGIEQNLLTVANGFARIDQAVGKTLRVRGWLRATDASNVRLRVTFDGTTYTNGVYHSGDDDWEGPSIHQIDVTIPVNATEMTVSIEKETGVAVQADMVVAWLDPIERYDLPTSLHPSGPHRIYIQRAVNNFNVLIQSIQQQLYVSRVIL